MANARAYTKRQVKHVLCEQSREFKSYKNRVDISRSNLNKTYGAKSSDDKMLKILQRCKQIMGDRPMQDNTNIAIEWDITFPFTLCDEVSYTLTKNGKTETLTRYTPKDQKLCEQFFDETLAFLKTRYGSDNFVSMEVHYDETTPHAHAVFVPTAISRKTGKMTISSASVLTLKELKSFHPDLEKHMQDVFGIEHMILNGRTKQGLTPEQIKAQQSYEKALAEYDKSLTLREKDVASAETMLAMVNDAISKLKQLIASRKNENKDVSAENKQLDNLYDIRAKLSQGRTGSSHKIDNNSFTQTNTGMNYSY